MFRPNNNESPFSYSNLSLKLTENIKSNIRVGNYSACILQMTEDFFYFNRIADDKDERKKLILSRGLKLHISLSAEPDTNIPLGWEIVRDILMKNNIREFKIVRPDFLKQGSTYLLEDPGREITIYTFKETDYAKHDEHFQRINKMIQEITEKLAAAKILPGLLPQKDSSISGSSYISYRDDSFKFQGVVGYAMTVTVDNQPERPLNSTVQNNNSNNFEF